MRMAIAQDANEVAAHFGRCPQYTLVDIADGRVVEQSVIDNPGHEPGFLPGFLSKRGVNCIIAGGMGPRAVALFREEGIDVIVGVSGSVDKTITDYLAGDLVLGDSFCEHEPGGS